MRHVISRLGLLSIALAGLTTGLATAPVQAQSSSIQSSSMLWGEPLDLQNASRMASGSIGADLITKVQEENVAWDQTFPGWYMRGEALFLHRDGLRPGTISVIDNQTFETLTDDLPVITNDDIEPTNFQGGWRAELGRTFGNGLALEGSFFIIDNWSQRAQFTSNGLLVTDPVLPGDALSPPSPPPDFAVFPVDDFYQALQHTVTYQSDLYSAEMNVKATWRWHNMVRSQLAGVRVLQLRDNFFLVSQDDRLSTPSNGFGQYDIRTKNTMIGAQYGEEAMMPILGSATLTVNGKVGLYANDIEQTRTIVNDGVFVVDTLSDKTNLTFVGEIGAHLNIKVTDMLSIRGGYNFFWLEGLALAPEQYTFEQNQQQIINDHGGLFLHGFSIGAELRR